MKATLIATLIACGHPVAHDQPRPVGPPRLVVLLVIDQLPQWAFVAKRPHLVDGFDRLLREGEWHTGEHPTPATSTAPGHALFGSGEPPAASGIIANEWWDRGLARMVQAVEDPGGGVSAAHLRVPALGDAIAAAHSGAKAVAVSLKARAAVLPLGHAGIPIWYDPKRAAFVSLRPIPWLEEHARTHPVSAHLKDVWTPRAGLAKLSGVADDRPGEIGADGLGPAFPHDLAAALSPADAIEAAPIGNQLALDVAEAAIDQEALGADATPDLLVVSLSVNDLVGHGWGHESWEAWDELLTLDEQLGRFLAVLDLKVGVGRWAMIATSDHGAAPTPAAGTGHITYEQLKEAANRAASAELGTGEWIASTKYPTVYLTAAARAKPAKDLARAVNKVMFALRAFPGIARVELTADFAGHCERRTGDAFLLCQMLDVERSGEILYQPRRGWIFEKAAEGFTTAHGSAFEYDREVPVIMLPPGRKTHAPLAKPSATTVHMIRISTILARWLGVTPPVSMKRSTK